MNIRKHIKIETLFVATILCSLVSISSFGQSNVFTEVEKDFPRQDKNLRKWDAPVVADLDQDGYLDLLINDHGFGIQVCWNNKGKFAKPYDIIMGDLHGVSAGDFDQDGNIEVIMSRGGGSGTNARNSKMYRIKGRKFIELPDFNTPLAFMRGRTVQFVDLNNDGYLDLLNFAFPGKEKKGESENYVYLNDTKGELIRHSTLPASKVNGQKSLITDFNSDGVFDIVMYGDKNVKIYKGHGDFTFTEVSKDVLPYPINNVNGVVEIDVDNDGDLDLFFNRGLEFEKGESFYDKLTETWGFFTKRGKFQFEDLETGDVLNIENFQSQWPNNDTYYIGEASYDYDFKGETHSGKDIRFVNSNALGFPDNADYNAKRGYYIGYVGNKKWRLAGYLFAPSTGIVRGVKDYPDVIHPKGLNDILLENIGKKFKDATKKFKLYNEAHTVASTVADFDNNGFQDLLVIKRGDLIHENESLIYLNQGDTGFTPLQNHNVISTELGAIGMAVENIDYNQDGKVDVVIGNERGKWHLFKNELEDAKRNSYLTVEVGSSTTGKATALGALVTLSSCGNSQVRRIGATGAQYSLSFNNFVHFGLGNCEKTIKIKVEYTNGEVIEQTVKSTNTKVAIGTKR